MKKIVAVEDNLAKKFGAPFVCESDEEALRLFKMTVNDKRNDLIYNNPEDYALWSLGEYDERTGLIIPEPNKIADAKSVKKEE